MSLKNLIALQQQKKAATESPAPAATPPAAAPVEAESPAEPEEATPPAEPAKPKGLGLNVAGNFKKPTAPVPTKTPASAKPKPAVESGEFSLEDLAGMDASSIPASSSDDSGPMFDDEIEATAPDRDLPPDLTAEQLSFVESLDGIYGVLHDSEMFGQTVRMIMIELQENPEYEKLMSDPDVHTMIRGMRRTMGLARVRKQEKSRKAGTNKNARKKAGVSDDAMALLNSLMGGSDD
jgi:hypothetical protein